jgi:hypothetical protein
MGNGSLATSGGLRVFSWHEFQSATDDPSPTFSIQPEPVVYKMPQGEFTVPGHVRGLAHDDRANRLIYAGGSGLVHFLDLASGRNGVLLDPPGRYPIHDLGLSRDRSGLCCICAGKVIEQTGNNRAALLQVWNYRALAGKMDNPPDLRLV